MTTLLVVQPTEEARVREAADYLRDLGIGGSATMTNNSHGISISASARLRSSSNRCCSANPARSSRRLGRNGRGDAQGRGAYGAR